MEATTTKAAFQKYPAYKDSGVDWLGELPKNWDEVPLCTLTKLKSVINCSELELLSVYLDLGVIKFSEVEAKRTNVTSQDLSKYQRVDIGDFVLNNQQAWRGSVGVSNHQGIVSPAYLVLELSKKLHTGYANYMFRSGYMVGQYLINSKGVGTIQRNLYWPSLRRAKVILPPLPEQTAIAAFLDDKTAKIDRAIAQKEKMITLLKERKQIIIQNAVTKGLKPNAKMKDSGVEWIGEIPEGWEVKKLFGISRFVRGNSTFGKDDLLSEGEYVALQYGKCYKVSEVDKDYEFYVNNEYFKESQVANYGDTIIISTSETIDDLGHSAFFNRTDVGLLGGEQMMLKPNKDNVNGKYLYYSSKVFSKQLRKFATGIKVYRFNTNDLKTIYTPIPPIQVQTAIVAHIETQSAKIDKALKLQEQQIEKLKELKSTLIDSAVTGKIKVS